MTLTIICIFIHHRAQYPISNIQYSIFNPSFHCSLSRPASKAHQPTPFTCSCRRTAVLANTITIPLAFAALVHSPGHAPELFRPPNPIATTYIPTLSIHRRSFLPSRRVISSHLWVLRWLDKGRGHATLRTHLGSPNLLLKLPANRSRRLLLPSNGDPRLRVGSKSPK